VTVTHSIHAMYCICNEILVREIMTESRFGRSNNDQWRSQTFTDGRVHYFYKILSIIYKHAGSYVHLLKGVVYMKMHTNSS